MPRSIYSCLSLSLLLSLCGCQKAPTRQGGSGLPSPDLAVAQVDAGAPLDAGNCGVQQFMLTQPERPDVLIVLDQSGSMNNDADNMVLPAPLDPASKWMQTKTALEQAVTTVTSINWGLMLFGSTAGFCSYYSVPNVYVSPVAGASISQVLDGITPSTTTPTHFAIRQATQYFQALLDGNAHYILLATDGEPNCANVVNGMIDLSNGVDSPEFNNPQPTFDAVADAANLGIHTFVTGIGGNNGAEATLSEIATQGLEPNTTPGEPAYYPVSSTTQLVDLLNNIAGQIVSCEYPLAHVPSNPDFVSLSANGAPIPRDPSHQNGWDYGADGSTVVFYGAACHDLQVGVTTEVSATFECEIG